MMTGSLLPLAPVAVELGFELLNSTCVAEFCGEGDACTLGDGEGSAEGSGEGLAFAGGCRGRRGCCCGALELALDVLEFSCAV